MQNLWYNSIRFLVKMAVKLFYRRIEIQGYANYPMEGPVLLAPNHQNAFMDALIPTVFAPRPVHFLVRADVFNIGIVRKIFSSFNMMPVYRQRDGIANLSKNDDIFEQCFEILRNNGTLLLFPEAGHLGGRKLRPLSKGFARIAFGALKDHDHLDVKIVPVGLNYDHYSESHSCLMMNYGNPISVKDYLERFEENPAKAMSNLREDLQERLEAEMIHVEKESHIRPMDIELERILPFYLHRDAAYNEPSAEHGFYKKREQQIQKISPDSQYFKRIEIYDLEMAKRKLRAPFFFIQNHSGAYWFLHLLMLVALSPLYLVSWAIHLPTVLLIKFCLGKFVKDLQFHSSIKMIGGLLLTPVFALIYATITAVVFEESGKAFIAAFLFTLLSIFIIRWLRLPYRYGLTKLRMIFLKLRNKALVKYLKSIEDDILKTL